MNFAPELVGGYAQVIEKMIEDDIAIGTVSDTVASFSELHCYVDANMYLIEAEVPWSSEDDGGLDLTNAVTDLVDKRIQARLAGKLMNEQPNGTTTGDTINVPLSVVELGQLRALLGSNYLGTSDRSDPASHALCGKFDHYFYAAGGSDSYHQSETPSSAG